MTPHALVLELVDGPTLAELIDAAVDHAPSASEARQAAGVGPRGKSRKVGGIALDNALSIALQIAAALEAAHAQGVVHRDLKPANIKVRPDGVVKVLDFGLARALGPEAPRATAEAMESPTMTSPVGITDSRAILGTAPYVSPEQARGKVVDKRADIWAFGCVLFEMLGGRRAFTGETSSDTIAAVLGREPDWNALPGSTPAGVRGLLRRCLEKDPSRRLRDIGDARIELEHVGRTTGEGAIPAARVGPGSAHHRALLIALAVVAVTTVSGVLYVTRSRTDPPLQYTRLTDFTDPVTSPSLSPDGRMLTFKSGSNFMQSPGEIYVKLLPNGESVRLTNDNVPKLGPVFTPDGSRIAYTQVRAGAWETWTVPVLGGQPTRLLPNAAGLTWIADQRVLFSEIRPGGIHMGIVTASEMRADSREIYFPAHQRGMAHFSHASPDRKWILVIEMDGTRAFQPCRLVPFDGSSPGRQVGPSGPCIAAAWSRDGKWMYFSATVDGSSHLWRQAFPSGAPQQVTSGPTEETGVAVAPDGSLVTSVGQARSAIWIRDETGERQVLSEGDAYLPRLSRDGRRVFYLRRPTELAGSAELHELDLASGRSANLLSGWSVRDYDMSQDETEVAFTVVSSDGRSQIWIAPLDRESPPRELLRGGNQPSFDADGGLLYRFVGENASFLFRIARDGSHRERVTDTPILEKMGSSPDGGWVTANVPAAGTATGSPGQVQTVAIPVQGGARRRICTFNCWAFWSPDGRFFRVALRPGQSTTTRSTTVFIPVPVGSSLPDLPEEGIASLDDALKLAGARVIDEDVVGSSPNGSAYVFVRRQIQRNLFRIQLGR